MAGISRGAAEAPRPDDPLLQQRIDVDAMTLRDPSASPVERRAAMDDLLNLGPKAAPAADVLVPRMLADLRASTGDAIDKNFARYMLVRQIGQLGPAARAAVPALVYVLRDDPREPFRSEAAVALGNIGPDASLATPDLLAVVRSDTTSDQFKLNAITALGKLGDGARDAVPELQRYASATGNQQLATAANNSIRNIENAPVTPVLAAARIPTADPKALYQQGDYAAALPLFREGARTGDAQAMYYLGWMMVEGLGQPRNVQRGIDWLERAAEKGNVDAMNSLGYIFSSGQSVEKDLWRAQQWYGHAANRGNELAKRRLQEIAQ